MTKIIYSISIIFLICGTTFSQKIAKPILEKTDGAILLAKISPNDDSTERIIHSIENTLDKFEKDPNSVYAVRICSTHPLPVAITDLSGFDLAVRQINIQSDYLKNTLFKKLPESNIFVLRNDKKCKAEIVPETEYWFVPSFAELPEFVEIRKAEDLSIKDLIFDYKNFDEKLLSISAAQESEVTPKYYEAIKSKLVEMLRQNKTALLIIEIPQIANRRKINKILTQATELKIFLTANKIGKHRIFLKKNGFNPLQNSNTFFYPNIKIVYQN